MSISDIRAAWIHRRDELARFDSRVDPTRMIDQFVADLDSLERALHAEAVTLREAHLIGGYSIDHLQRLVASGEIENVGRKGKPRIRRVDVPSKPGHGLRAGDADSELHARRRIVASVITEKAS